MIKPGIMENLYSLMESYIEERYRPYVFSNKKDFEMGITQKSGCMSDRPEFLVAIHRFIEQRYEIYEKFKRLILPILLHPRHDHIRFSNKPGEEGFYVNQQTLNSSLLIMEKISTRESIFIKSDESKISNAKFRSKSVRMRGLLGLLKKTFWPNYNSEVHSKMAKSYFRKEKKRKRVNGKETKKKKAVIKISTKDKKSSHGCSWNTIDNVINSNRGVGVELGKQIHNQLERFSRDHIAFALSKDKPDPITSAVIDKIVSKWNMIPIWGELEIWDEVLKYGTAIDMVCINPKDEGSIVFLEIKTGYKEIFQYANRKVQGNIGIWDSPLGHAMLQLIIPIQTMKLRYGVSNITGYVIHVNEIDGVTAYKLPIDDPKHKAGVSYSRIYNYMLKRENGGPVVQGIIKSKKRKGGYFDNRTTKVSRNSIKLKKKY